MAPSTLDLLVLTFNCAKSLINAGVFARHLHTALSANSTGLPDVVVFSLQEVAPLSQSFIGDYFLNPYFARFDEALNLAAGKPRHQGDTEQTQGSSGPQKKPYTLVRAHNVGYTAILLFAKDASRIRELQDAEVGFGAAEMGNKGAVGLRALYDVGKGQDTTELTFVATHLAAMEWNLPRRNANWATIMRGMTFENPETVLDQFRGSEGSGTSSPPTPVAEAASEDDMDAERRMLLQEEHDEQHKLVQQQLHDISVFKPTSHLFVAGDLNYRISTTAPPPNAAFPSLDPSSEHYYPTFFPLDQLTRERRAGRTFHGMSEAEVRFPPTYKYNAQPKLNAGMSDDEETTVPSKFASHRWPSWTDRVLYLDIPKWVKGSDKKDAPKMDIRAYDALPLMRSSDHRAVFLRVNVPLISPEDLRPPAAEVGESRGGSSELVDPRARLPVEIDPEAWERRRAARRKELLTGWSAFLWSTKEGAWILATMLVGGMSVYWLYTMR